MSPTLPNTPTVRALQALNIRPGVIAELADAPMSAVEAAIRNGKGRAEVTDLAGWVVAALRAGRS